MDRESTAQKVYASGLKIDATSTPASASAAYQSRKREFVVSYFDQGFVFPVKWKYARSGAGFSKNGHGNASQTAAESAEPSPRAAMAAGTSRSSPSSRAVRASGPRRRGAPPPHRKTRSPYLRDVSADRRGAATVSVGDGASSGRTKVAPAAGGRARGRRPRALRDRSKDAARSAAHEREVSRKETEVPAGADPSLGRTSAVAALDCSRRPLKVHSKRQDTRARSPLGRRTHTCAPGCRASRRSSTPSPARYPETSRCMFLVHGVERACA